MIKTIEQRIVNLKKRMQETERLQARSVVMATRYNVKLHKMYKKLGVLESRKKFNPKKRDLFNRIIHT